MLCFAIGIAKLNGSYVLRCLTAIFCVIYMVMILLLVIILMELFWCQYRLWALELKKNNSILLSDPCCVHFTAYILRASLLTTVHWLPWHFPLQAGSYIWFIYKLFSFLYFFFILGLYSQHMEVSKVGVVLELPLQAYVRSEPHPWPNHSLR